MGAEWERHRRWLDAQHIQRGPASPVRQSFTSLLDPPVWRFAGNPDVLALRRPATRGAWPPAGNLFFSQPTLVARLPMSLTLQYINMVKFVHNFTFVMRPTGTFTNFQTT